MIKVAIVEDDKAQADQLQDFIEKYGGGSMTEFIIEQFSDGMHFISEYSAKYDIVFMDIEMPLLDGISTARKLRELDENVCLIFVTNLAKYALVGYEVNAMDYLLKPLEYFNFSVKLEKAIRLISNRKIGFLQVKTDTGIRKINVDKILHIEVFGHNTEINFGGEVLATRTPLSVIVDKLPKLQFFQCSRSIIINLKYLDEITDCCAVVNNQRIKISKSKMADLLDAMAEYCAGNL